MKTYFELQFKMFNRNIIAFGLPLLIAYTLIPSVFIIISNYLFSKTEFASYLYIFVALGFISKSSEPKRNDFLKSIYNKMDYFKLRAVENLIYSLPFLIFLAYKGLYLYIIALSILAISMTVFNFNTNLNITIPTPFGKKPFEFTVGFRKTFFIFPMAYFLTYISIEVGNFNLGVFSMVMIGITCMSYYSKIENEYFVWSYNVSSKEFLSEKVKTGLLNFSLLSLPSLMALGIFFFNEIGILLIVLFTCYLYLVTIIFAKYASFPKEMNISQGILIAGSLLFPPILLFIAPFFYSQSIKRLNSLLE
ncbi:ABC transporter permease [Bizionia arctica]|uniref:Uncharacterized protein n=1 Tax=Bizionia arctica TaxID=1495645 RepID=A0A917LQM3_9FLAO|nr:ABC transporter permease [Bizionia arctica]GGG50629.1 hypothetical protein GCM10010976_22310 [Bizionia arctica]